MQATAQVKREFCRRLFRLGGASANARNAFLDLISDASVKAQQDGKALVEASSSSTAAKFAMFAGWTPGDVLELVDSARAWADAPDVNSALLLIADPIKSTRFQCALER